MTEEKQKNQIAPTECRFIKTIIIIRDQGRTTVGSLPPHPRDTPAKDGRVQGGHCEQNDAVECIVVLLLRTHNSID